MYYFAYGSNMLTARLAERVPTVRPIGRGWLDRYRLYFHLRGSDGSGKCNIRFTDDPAHRVHGVVYELDARRLDRLHAAEGAPYAFVELEIGTPAGALVAATYRGREAYLDDDLLPYDWYCDFVTTGAREHGLPSSYLARLDSQVRLTDTNRERALSNRRILESRPSNVLRSGA